MATIIEPRHFGACIRTLRASRGLTQQDIADRGGLSVDSVRRIEAGAMSPSLATVGKLAAGLGMSLGSVFRYCDEGKRDLVDEIAEFLATQSPADIKRAERVLAAMFDEDRARE